MAPGIVRLVKLVSWYKPLNPWQRWLSYLSQWRHIHTTNRLAADRHSSWTNIDIDKTIEEETEKRDKEFKPFINISSLFEGKDSVLLDEKGKNNKKQIYTRENLANPVNSNNESKRQSKNLPGTNDDQRNRQSKYFSGSNVDQRNRKLKNLSGTYVEQRSRQVNKFSVSNNDNSKPRMPQYDRYAKSNSSLNEVGHSAEMIIPENCHIVSVSEFDLEKFLSDHSLGYQATSTEVGSRLTDFGQLFTQLWQGMLLRGEYQAAAEWETVEATLRDTATEMRLAPHFVKHWPTRFMVAFTSADVSTQHSAVIQSLWDFAGAHYNQQHPVLLMAAYMAVLATLGKETEALHLYQQIKQRTNGVTEITVYSHIVNALSKTHQWRECEAIVESLEKFYGNMRSVQDCWFHLAAAYLLHGHTQEYNKVVSKLNSQGYDPTDGRLLEKFLKQANMSSGSKVLQTFSSNMWLPNVSSAKAILTLMKEDTENSWTVMPTAVDNGGRCLGCGGVLNKMRRLSVDQFSLLQTSAVTALVEGHDIYLKSNPIEKQAFLNFKEKHGPFDIVVDGLNIYYAKKQRLKTLKNAIADLRRKYPEKPNILVVLRQHVLHELKVKKNENGPSQLLGATVFALRNDSEDDPYLLLAALGSGPDTMFVSNDDYTDQSFVFGAHLRPFFLSWQRSNQIFYDREAYGVSFKWPKVYEHSVQEHEHGWHIPFCTSNHLVAKVRPSNTWLCCLKQPKP